MKGIHLNTLVRASRKLIVLILVAAIMLTTVAFIGSASAATTYCIAWSIRFTNTGSQPLTIDSSLYSLDPEIQLVSAQTFTLPPGETRDARVLGFAPRYAWFAITFLSHPSFSYEFLNYGQVGLENCLGGKIGDGRLNDGGDQLAAPVAVYDTDQGLDVYLINPENGNGDKIFTVTDDEVTNVGDAPAENTMLDGAKGVGLYRLTSGEFQINATNFDGSPYVFDWK
jgi:hypothetical protein